MNEDSNFDDEITTHGQRDSFEEVESERHRQDEEDEHPIDGIIETIENMVPITRIHIANSAATTTATAIATATGTSANLHQKIIHETNIPQTLCAHPTHMHSFTRLTNLSSLMWSRFSICPVCSTRISLVTSDVITCLACSIFVHRKCAQSKELPVCLINQSLLDQRKDFINRINGVVKHGDDHDHNSHGNENENESGEVGMHRVTDANHSETLKSASVPPVQQPFHSEHECSTTDAKNVKILRSASILSVGSDSNSDASSSSCEVWSSTGPPAHWAMAPGAPSFLKGIKSNNTNASTNQESEGGSGGKHRENEGGSGGKEEDPDWKSSFANLSRVLQMNLFVNRQDKAESTSASTDDKDGDSSNNKPAITTENIVHFGNSNSFDSDDKGNDMSTNTSERTMEHSKAVVQSVSRTMQSNEHQKSSSASSTTTIKNSIPADKDHRDEDTDVSVVLKEAKPNPPPPSKTQSVLRGTVDVMKKTNQTRKNMGVVSFAGGITGATAGLIVGGPAGAFVGSQIGKVVGAGVAVINTIGVGVFVGVTGTVLTVKSLKGDGNRMVTIGGEGSEKVVLVRPNVVVDPVWEEITMKARRSAPRDTIMNGFSLFGEKKMSRVERNRRAKDIVYSEEVEISTQDKIFLLVANSLNDKESLPGYVYRELIREAKERVNQRKEADKDGASERAIRQDVHGIIKNITATLLEVRPGFSSSARITEMSALAVETMVFGELYDHVMEEINSDPAVYEKDQNLDDKLSQLKEDAEAAEVNTRSNISDEALRSIRMMPQHHSIENKLKSCVELLEHVSELGAEASMGADFLLTLVCQHLAVACVPKLNAECSFLEEFATDEQLLQGKEGYALVTIQACVHFLNASQNLLEDVFQNDDC